MFTDAYLEDSAELITVDTAEISVVAQARRIAEPVSKDLMLIPHDGKVIAHVLYEDKNRTVLTVCTNLGSVNVRLDHDGFEYSTVFL